MKNSFKRTGCATRSAVCRRPNTHTASKHSDIQFAHISLNILPHKRRFVKGFPLFQQFIYIFPLFRNILCLSQKDGGQKPAVCARDAENRKGENRFSAAESICCRVFVIVQNLFHIFRTCGILRKRLCDIQDRKIVPHVIFAVNRIFDSVFDVNGIRSNGETTVVFCRRRSDNACRIRNRRVGKGEIAEVFT